MKQNHASICIIIQYKGVIVNVIYAICQYMWEDLIRTTVPTI